MFAESESESFNADSDIDLNYLSSCDEVIDSSDVDEDVIQKSRNSRKRCKQDSTNIPKRKRIEKSPSPSPCSSRLSCDKENFPNRITGCVNSETNTEIVSRHSDLQEEHNEESNEEENEKFQTSWTMPIGNYENFQYSGEGGITS